MSILGVAIVPPHPTQLSLRMAVAIYVTGISTPEVHPEFPPLLGTLTRGGAAESPGGKLVNRYVERGALGVGRGMRLRAVE
jgi:hypothetical protein